MKIRSFTCFFDPCLDQPTKALVAFSKLAERARTRFEEAGYELETTRVVTTPFSTYLPSALESAQKAAYELAQLALANGFTYLSLGPAQPESPESYKLIVPVLKTSNIIFMSAEIADQKGIHLPAVRASGEIIAQLANVTPDGFTNLRFAALARVRPFTPFFPAAFSIGSERGFALALECADEVVVAYHEASSLQSARDMLLERLNGHAARLEEVCVELQEDFGPVYKGMDFSPAPFPQDACSLGGALESLGVGQIGKAGSLAAAAFTAEALDRGNWKRVGFNGLMLPVLEDSVLARRSAEGTLTVKDLLLFSAVCGTGLDTVPLPGATTGEEISALLLDVAALAMRLNKPLTARLMPIPGKVAGDATDFNFDYFSNGRVMALESAGLKGLFAGGETFTLEKRKDLR